MLVFLFPCFPFLFGRFQIFCQLGNSSHTRESMTDKALCSIGYGAKNKSSSSANHLPHVYIVYAMSVYLMLHYQFKGVVGWMKNSPANLFSFPPLHPCKRLVGRDKGQSTLIICHFSPLRLAIIISGVGTNF